MNRPMAAATRPADSVALAALEPVRRRFIDMTEARILTLESLRLDIVNGRDAESAMREFARTAHKIAGVAATLGFAQLGALAARVDQMLGEGMKPGTGAETWTRAEATVEAMLDAMEALLDP